MGAELINLINEGKICPYCGTNTEYIDSDEVYSKSYGMIYICRPCDAYVGVHPGTHKAKGRLANEELRYWKKEAHHYFDKIWQAELDKGESKYIVRNRAYEMLGKELNIEREYTHIGFFDVELCRRTIDICMKMQPYDDIKSEIEYPLPKNDINNTEAPTIRDERVDRFENEWLEKFKDKFGNNFWYDGKKFCYTLEVNNDGVVDVFDFYPKANKVLFRKKNKWYKPGLSWLNERFKVG